MNTRWLDVLRLRIRSLVHRQRVDAELERELRSHLDELIEENIRDGKPPNDARREAILAFGRVTQLTEESRDSRGVAPVENLLRDLLYTLRGLLREPKLLLTATISIAIGAAGNVAVFSLAKEFLFATPDVRDAGGLVSMRVSHSSHASYQRWRDLDSSGILEHVVGFTVDRRANWFRSDEAVSIMPMVVTANFFDVLGPPISRGRGFTTEEARAEHDPRVTVVSYTFWQHDLGADSAVVGRSLSINGAKYRVVGVLAPESRTVAGLGIAPSLYLPVNRALTPEYESSSSGMLQLIGRLKPDQTVSSARVALDMLDKQLARAEGDSTFGGVQQFGRIGSLVDNRQKTLAVFFGMVSVVSVLVLLIACGNVAGLLLARGAAKRPEIAIRLALGGTRIRVVQQLMVEAFWLALIGTLAGLGLSALAMRMINAWTLPISMPVELHLALDTPVLLFALALVFVKMFAYALLPALGATRVSLMPALKRDTTVRVGRRFTTRRLLLSCQVMVSTMLLVTALLFVRNLQQSEMMSPGFDVDRVVVLQIGFNRGRATEDQSERLAQLALRAQELPGVASATFATFVPLTVNAGSSSGRSAHFSGQPKPQHIEFAEMEVGAGYFGTVGIRQLAGRDFASRDRIGAPNTVIVNEEFSRKYLGGNAMGKRFRYVDEKMPVEREIVGVVANSKYSTLGEEARPAIYLPLAQQPARRDIGFLYVRVNGDPATHLASLREAVGSLDRSISVDVMTMHTAVAFALLPSRIGAAILGGLGLMGLLLAAFGLYAIIAYNVSRRTSEIAVRCALGATRRTIVALVIRDALMLVGIGVTAGLVLAAFATRVLSTFLVAGLSATDATSFVGTAVLFLAITALASWHPARYAMQINPAMAMRLE